MLRFLHVDDDLSDLELCARELRQELGEIEIVPVSSPVALAEQLLATEPDVVITDFQLQWSDGIRVLHAARQAWPTVPVVMFTGSGNEEIAVQAMKSGLDDYVVKSSRAGHLAAAVRRVMEGARARGRAGELQALLEQLGVGVARVRAPGRELIDANAAFLELLGVREPGQVSASSIQALVTEGAEEVEVVRADGTARWVKVRLAPGRGDQGEPVLEGLFEDVTTRKKLEIELREQAEQLAQEGRNKDRFLSILSHELRNPLGAITNSLFLLNRPGVDPAISAKALEMMTRQVKHLRRLVDELLDLSRINRDAVALQKESLDMVDAVKKAADVVRPVAREQRQELTLHLPQARIAFEADPVRMEQILTNLMGNAVHYTPAGGRIQVFLENGTEEIVIKVTDNGMGIPGDMLERIFQPFEKVEPSSERTLQWGLGIGLTLVKGLVEAHGGHVQAFSQGKNLGSEFIIRFPR